MDCKGDKSPPLKLFKNLYCTNCKAQFIIRDLVSKGSRCPMLLQCGHSICESCLQQCLKNVKSISCQECNFVSSRPSEGHGSDGFPLSIYALGTLVGLQYYKLEKDKKLALFTKNSGNFNYSLKRQLNTNLQVDSSKSVCEECSLGASWYCENCKSNFCETCWSKVHGSAKSLMRHCKTALSLVESLKSGLKKCSKHETQDLEFFCTGCSATICSHCVILQHQGEGHCPITLKEKNIGMISKVRSAAEEAEITKKKMKQTLEEKSFSDYHWLGDQWGVRESRPQPDTALKLLRWPPVPSTERTREVPKACVRDLSRDKINLTQNSYDVTGNGLISDFEKRIVRNFSRMHGILQLEEERHLKKLRDIAIEREVCLKALSKQLEAQMENVEALLSECEFAVKKPQCSDLTELHRHLEEVQNWPCYLISRKAQDLEAAKITFDEKLVEHIRTYCSMDIPSNEIFELTSSADLPDDYSVEPLNDSDSFQEMKFSLKIWAESSASDVDTLSNCSSRELTRADPRGDLEARPSSTAAPPPKVFERRSYSVRVTYIKNPGEFYVTLNSQRSRQLAIDKRAQFGQLARCSGAPPQAVSKDEVYLVKYNVDMKWYRGRVVETSGRKMDGEECVVIYYLDYGNTETVPLSRLRMIPADIAGEPPLAVKCKLFDCVPKNGEWCVESTKTMEKILNNYTATMFIMKIQQDCLEVDLSVIYPEGHIGRDLVSVRDALLFLEFSSLVNGAKIPQNAMAVNYLHQCLPAIGEAFDAIITHVNSPSDFYIQRTKQGTSYLFKLTTDLQNYYEENSHKGAIYNPLLGMPCAALFSADHKWYRAKVVDIPGKKMVTVFYVDYGNKETIPWTWIRKLRECFVKRPPMALNCSLAGIHSIDVDWSSQTKQYLEKCVLVKDCRVHVHSRPRSKQKLKVLLYKRVNNREICVNTLFVEMGYAAKTSPKPGSLWIQKVREQEGTSAKSTVSKAEESKSDILLNEERPATDTENGPHRKSQIFAERKKSKLSAKKLRELHEHEKKYHNRSPPPGEESEGEVDDYDNVFKVKVDVLSAESPSSVYVTFPALMEEFKNLQLKLNEFYKNPGSVPAKEWVAGSVCAVYYSVKSSWYRASVLNVLPDSHVKVFLKDVARVATEPASSLRELDPSFTEYATCAVKCHLADIGPPGDQWPSISSEFLLNELENYKEVYMTKRGQIDNKSLPVELWVKKIVSRGALEPTSREWITLNKLLVNQGLAVPKKSKSWAAVAPPSDDEEDSNEADESREAFQKSLAHQMDAQVSDEATESSDAFVPSLGSRWLPPEPLNRTRFFGVPTYVDSDACIYIHDIEQDEEKLKAVCELLLEEYENSKPTAEDLFWSSGQMCIARYHVDNCWYRGLVLGIHENVSYDVLFIDYGNVEICQASDLRKRIKMQEIPVITHKFKIQGIEPVSEDGKWPISVLEILHSLVVEKKCQVNISEFPLDPSEACAMSLKIVEDDIDVGMFLVDQGLAVVISPSRESSGTSSPDFCSLQRVSGSDLPKASDDLYVSRYSSLSIPVDCKGFFVKVTTLISENEFFGNIVDEETLPASLKNVLNELEKLQEGLTKEGHSQALIENLVKGAPCCCLYPENNKWCRGEVESFRRTENSVCVFYVDDGNKGLVDKDLLHQCRKEWLSLPKMAVKFRLANVERCATVSKSVYMKTLTDYLKKAMLFAEIRKGGEVLEVRLLTGESGSLVYQDMINQNLMRFVEKEPVD